MAWNKQFQRATIEKKNNVYVLTIYYNYYYMFSFNEVFVEATIETAKTRLLKERSADHITYFEDGKEISQLN
jgi:hypothetical protein